MSKETQLLETLQCLPDAVEHLIHGDPDDADSVRASDAVTWAIAEIARLREERRSITTLLGKVEALEADNERLRDEQHTLLGVIETRFEYVDVRVVGDNDRLAVCLGFSHGFDGTPIHAVGTVTYNPGAEYVFDTCGETLLRLMQVAGVDALDRVANRPVRAVVRDGIPIELISATDDRIRWRLP